MQKINDQKDEIFLLVVPIQILFACFVLYNEVMSISNRAPGGNYPIEHYSSWERVITFCAVALIGAVFAWLLRSRRHWIVFLPSLRFAMVSAVLPLFLGVFPSHYLSLIGWCCESSAAFFFGFPFSFLNAHGKFNPYSMELFKLYKNLNFVDVLNRSELVSSWGVLPYSLFLDYLFWIGVMYILYTLISFLLRKGKVSPQVSAQTQRDSSAPANAGQ